MVTRELLDFLRAQRSTGVSRQRLIEVLLAEGGWSKADLDEAFAQLEGVHSPSASKPPAPPAAEVAQLSTPPEPQRPSAPPPRTLAERVASPKQTAPIFHADVPGAPAPGSEKGGVAFSATPVPKPAQTPGVDPHEDFLGIFSSSTFSSVSHASDPAAIRQPAPAPAPATKMAQAPTPESQRSAPVAQPSHRALETAASATSAASETRPVVRPASSSPQIPTLRQPAPAPAPKAVPITPAIQTSSSKEPFELRLDPGEDFLGIFAAYEHPTAAPRAAETPRPATIPSQPAAPAPLQPPVSVPPLRPKAVPSIVSELSRPQKVVPHHQAPAINVASMLASRPIMSAPPSKGFIPTVSKTITPSKPLPPRPVTPSSPAVLPVSGVAPSVSATMLTDAERAAASTGPRRISSIAPPKRTLEDLFLRVQGQAVSSSVVASDSRRSSSTPPPPPPPQDSPIHEQQVSAAPPPAPPRGVADETDARVVRRSTDPGFPVSTGFFSRPGVKMLVIIGVVLLCVGAAAFVYMTLLSDDTPDVSAALSELRRVPAFSYGVRATVNLSIGENDSAGEVAFEIIATGTVAQSAQGIGDGKHSGIFSGRARIGDASTRAIALEGDIRVLSDTAYLYARSSPVEGKIDPEILRRYWIAVPIADVTQELSRTISASSSSVSSFTGGRNTRGILALLAEHMPLVTRGETRRTTIGDVETTVVDIALSPEATLQFLRMILTERFGTELLLTEEEKAFTYAALEKAHGTLAIDADGFPRRFTLSFAPNNRLFGERVTGTIDVELIFAPLEGVLVTRPEMSLTIGELEIEMERYQEYSQMKARDAERVRAVEAAQAALEVYRNERKRYPTQLSELSTASGTMLSTIASSTLAELVYYGYLRAGAYSREDRCAFRSATCPAYHIGISLEDADNPYLDIDADISGDILGADLAGCAGEEGKICLDRTEADHPDAPITAESVNRSGE